HAVMVGAVVAYAVFVALGWPFPLALVVTLGALAGFGALVERVAVRPFFLRASPAWLLATIAVGIIAENVAQLTFGKDARAFSSPRSSTCPPRWAPSSGSKPSRWPSSADSPRLPASCWPDWATGWWRPLPPATSRRGRARSWDSAW